MKRLKRPSEVNSKRFSSTHDSLTLHKIIMIHMKLSTDKTESGFTCKLHCMHAVVRVVCVSAPGRTRRTPHAPARARTRPHAHAHAPRPHRRTPSARTRARPCGPRHRVHGHATHTPILSPAIYYFDLYFMYRARTPGGKRFIC